MPWTERSHLIRVLPEQVVPGVPVPLGGLGQPASTTGPSAASRAQCPAGPMSSLMEASAQARIVSVRWQRGAAAPPRGVLAPKEAL